MRRPPWLITCGMFWLAASAAWSDPMVLADRSTATVHSIEFTGNAAIDAAGLESRISVKRKGPYQASQVDFSRDIVQSVYRDKGFADVRVSTRTTAVAPGQVDILFRIEEGELYRIGAITIEGNHLISDKRVRRDLHIDSGQPFSQAQIYEAYKRLFLSGYFETIDIHYSSAAAHGMDVRVRVKERPTQYVKGGFGYGTQTKERLSMGYEDRNFLGNEKQLDLSAVHSGFLTNPAKYRTTILETSLAQPHLFDTSFEGQTSVSEEWDDRQAYNARTTAWRSSVGRRFGDHISASLRYRLQGTQLTRIDPSASTTTLPFTSVSALGPAFNYDNTNDPFLPTIGWRIGGLFEKGLTLGAGDTAFQRFEARAGRFDSAGRFTFFAGLQFALVRPDHPGDSIPIFERYMLGGANTVRGYEQQELGPRDTQGNPLGGNAFAVGNLEVRHALYKKLYGVWFLDGGQLYVQSAGEQWPRIQAKGLGDFAYGTGPGVRLNTPVGAIRLEVGYKLNPPSAGADFLHRTAIDFSLGEVF